MIKNLYTMRFNDLQHDTIFRFLKKYFPESKFKLSKSNSLSRWYIYNDDRSKYLKWVEDDCDENFEGVRVEYKDVAPGSSVGRLELTSRGSRILTVYLKPEVKISTNFNAMLTELLPIAWLRAGNVPLIDQDGFLKNELIEAVTEILQAQGKPQDQIQNLLNQLEQKGEYVRVKRREIEQIRDFYKRNADRWNIEGAIFNKGPFKWLGYDKTVKNYGYVDRADVQIGHECRVSLKSVAPTDAAQKIFLCNTTFRAFMNDIQKFTEHRDLQPSDDIVFRAAEIFGARTYGQLLEKYFEFLFKPENGGLKWTYHVLHYILGDYRKSVRRDGTGYNHILLTSNGEPKELTVDDGFISEALNAKPKMVAEVGYENGKMVLLFGTTVPRQKLDVQFTDRVIRESDPSMSLKFKILEKL